MIFRQLYYESPKLTIYSNILSDNVIFIGVVFFGAMRATSTLPLQSLCRPLTMFTFI